MNSVVFVIMAKKPEPGETKTRLVPPLTYQEAAELYEALLMDTIAMLSGLLWADLALAISPPRSEGYFRRVTPARSQLVPIEGEDLGVCLRKSLSELLSRGYQQVIAVNADGPSLPLEYLWQAVAFLMDHEVVLGEGHDGGYYLVGVKADHRGLFEKITWSTENVLTQTLDRAAEAGLRVALTPQWYDIDTVEDIRRLKKELLNLPPTRLVHTRRVLESFKLP